MTDVTMPRLSDSMTEGTILSWLRHEGETVVAGEELVEIETDKATMTHAADLDGVLEIVAGEGSTVAVGEVIARVGARVAEAPAGPAADPPPPPPAPPAAHPAPASAAAVTAPARGPGSALATPVARRMARRHGVALDDLRGSGPRGRITRRDVEHAAGLPETGPAAPAETPAANGAGADEHVVAASRVQRLIARRMAESKATVPHFQVQTEVVMDDAVALRAQLKAVAGPGPAPSLNDLVLKAAALALREHPRANGSYRDGAFVLHDRVNVGVAVAAEDALVVPVVADADRRSLGGVAAESRRLAEKVRVGAIEPADLEGATFTVSNLGMFGMTAIWPVIDAPQAAILGVGAVRETLARVDGEIRDRALLTLTLSCDHRILYGADAARFLADIRERLETPLRLML